jgi:hypothetical protein
MYVWVHIALLSIGLGIFARPEVGMLAVLSVSANRALAACIITGSALALAASLMGIGWFVPRASADLRLPYGCGAGGQVAVVFSLFFYAIVICAHTDMIGTLAGGFSIFVGCGCAQYETVMIKEYFRARRLVERVS